MNAITPRTLTHVLGATLLRSQDDQGLSSVFTDTRKPVAGGIFFALKGPNHDGHEHLDAAVNGGARCLVISRSDVPTDAFPMHVSVLEVDDTLAALTRLAVFVRSNHPGHFFAVTGSVGKTSVKDMLAAALGIFGKVGFTPGNFNNHIGLPLTLCGLDGDEDFVILELGMSAPGEIAALTRICRPDVAVVTCATAAHLEFFPDVDAIADAKAELYRESGPETIHVVNMDDARLVDRAQALSHECQVSFGADPAADYRIAEVLLENHTLQITIQQGDTTLPLQLKTLGRHHASNAAATLAAVGSCGLDLQRASESLAEHFKPAAHRLEVLHAASGLTILDDAYNANPASTIAALETLQEVAADADRRGAVLGSMLELGPTAPSLHARVGRIAAEKGVDWLATVGPFAEDIAQGARSGGISDVRSADTCEAIVDDVKRFAEPGRWLLIKGSRSNHLERLIPELMPKRAQGGC